MGTAFHANFPETRGNENANRSQQCMSPFVFIFYFGLYVGIWKLPSLGLAGWLENINCKLRINRTGPMWKSSAILKADFWNGIFIWQSFAGRSFHYSEVANQYQQAMGSSSRGGSSGGVGGGSIDLCWRWLYKMNATMSSHSIEEESASVNWYNDDDHFTHSSRRSPLVDRGIISKLAISSTKMERTVTEVNVCRRDSLSADRCPKRNLILALSSHQRNRV